MYKIIRKLKIFNKSKHIFTTLLHLSLQRPVSTCLTPHRVLPHCPLWSAEHLLKLRLSNNGADYVLKLLKKIFNCPCVQSARTNTNTGACLQHRADCIPLALSYCFNKPERNLSACTFGQHVVRAFFIATPSLSLSLSLSLYVLFFTLFCLCNALFISLVLSYMVALLACWLLLYLLSRTVLK